MKAAPLDCRLYIEDDPMKQRSFEETEEVQALLDEYERLSRAANVALSSNNLRSRPNWHRFYEAHDQIISVVERLKSLNGH
jgi:hypothetical protein